MAATCLYFRILESEVTIFKPWRRAVATMIWSQGSLCSHAGSRVASIATSGVISKTRNCPSGNASLNHFESAIPKINSPLASFRATSRRLIAEIWTISPVVRSFIPARQDRSPRGKLPCPFHCPPNLRDPGAIRLLTLSAPPPPSSHGA